MSLLNSTTSNFFLFPTLNSSQAENKFLREIIFSNNSLPLSPPPYQFIILHIFILQNINPAKNRGSWRDYFRNFGTDTQIIIAIVRIIPIDVHLAIIGIEIHVRDVAVRVTRASFLINFFNVTGNSKIRIT